MKKQIPEKIANKVYSKILPGNRYDSLANDWVEEILYKPGTTEIFNRFFKNKASLCTYKCRCRWCMKVSAVLLLKNF